VTEGDDSLAVDLYPVVLLQELRELKLRPFVRGHRVSNWTVQYRDCRAESIVRCHGAETSFIQSFDMRSPEHRPATDDIATAMEIQCCSLSIGQFSWKVNDSSSVIPIPLTELVFLGKCTVAVSFKV
jgi:hypothetical protein